MLVLSRRPNEKIVIPGLNITVVVVGMKPGAVRIGIEAPANVKVFREEVLDRERSVAEAGRSAQLCGV